MPHTYRDTTKSYRIYTILYEHREYLYFSLDLCHFTRKCNSVKVKAILSSNRAKNAFELLSTLTRMLILLHLRVATPRQTHNRQKFKDPRYLFIQFAFPSEKLVLHFYYSEVVVESNE